MQLRATRATSIAQASAMRPLAQQVRAILASLRASGTTIVNQLIHEQWAYQQRMLAEHPGDASKCVLFQDSAGTIPVTAMEQQIGLALDLETAGVRGVELVTNGTFSSGTTGWSFANGTGDVVSGELELTSAGSGNGATSVVFPLTAGKTYEFVGSLRAHAANVTANSARVYLVGPSAAVAAIKVVSSNGTNTPYSFVVTPATTGNYNILGQVASGLAWGAVGDRAYFDNISVREIPGVHMIQPTAPKRAILSKRVNLLVGTAALATQTVTVIAGSHRLQFSGAGTVTLSGAATGALSAGSHTITTTAGSLTLTVSGAVTFADLRPTADVHPSVPDYQRVTSATDYDTAGFVVTKRWDGTDDAYASAGTLDLTGTDEVTVFAPVLKESDAASAIAFETSANANITNGAFHVVAPGSSGANSYRTAFRGTATTEAPVSGIYPAPHKAVLGIIGKIGADRNVMRVNGAQVASNSGDLGTGNYGNHTVFEGARNQTSLYFRGRSGGFMLLGENLTPAQQAIMERWVNQSWRAY